MKSVNRIYRYLIIAILILITINVVQAKTLFINEIQYNNTSTLTDNYQKSPDWIEIYNSGNEPINLLGYILTDKIGKDNYWTFPDIQILSKEFLVVFASGKNTKYADNLHTNFKLKVMNDNVYLLSPQMKIIDSVVNTCVPMDYSLARIPDGSDNISVTLPTPYKSNSHSRPIALNYQYDTLTDNFNSGYYKNSITLKLNNTISNNKIYYTTDGSDPDTECKLYSGAINISDISNNDNIVANKVDKTAYKPGKIHKGTVIKAQVFSEGCPASNIITKNYFIGKNPFVAKYTISIVTDNKNLFDDETGIYTTGKYQNCYQRGKDWERDAYIEIFDNKNKCIVSQNIGLRLHGNSTRIADQKSFKIYAEDYFEYPFFEQKPELTKFNTLMLKRSNPVENGVMNDEFSNHIVDDMNMDYCATETVIVYLNGEYWGIYSLRERQDVEYLKSNHGISCDKVDIITYNINDIKVEDGTDAAYNYLIDYLENNDPTEDDFFANVSSLIDIDNMIDYYVAQFYFANSDFPNNNLRMWNSSADNSKWRYLFYDLDYGMRWVNDNLFYEYMIDNEAYKEHPEFSTIILKQMMANREFSNMFYSRFLYCLNNKFELNNMLAKIDDFEKRYAPLIPDHIHRWFENSEYSQWQNSIKKLENFVIQRPMYLKKQLYKSFGTPYVVQSDIHNKTISVDFLTDEASTIKIFNLHGKMVVYDNYSGLGSYSCNHVLSPGIYVLQVAVGSSTFSQKIRL